MQYDWIDLHLFLLLLVLFIYILTVSNITTLHKAYLAFHSLMMLWPICHFFINAIPDAGIQWVFVNIAFWGLSFLGFGWVVFALLLTNKINSFNKKSLYLLAMPAFLSFTLVTTNPWHYLFAQPDNGGWATRTYGPFFWLFVATCIFYLIIATTIMLKTRAHIVDSNVKKQLNLCLAGITLILLFSFLDILFNVIIYPVFGVVPGLISLGIIISAVCFVIAIQKYDLFKIINIARREVFDSMTTGIIVIDKEELILDLNSSAAKLSKFLPGQVFDINKVLAASEKKELDYNFINEYNSNKFKCLQTEVVNLNGRTSNISITVSPVYNDNNSFIGRIITLNDITEYRMLLDEINEKNAVLQQQNKELLKVQQELSEANMRLEQISIKDELTDCYNKRYLLQQLTHEIALAQRHKRLFSIMLIDLDNFKMINDKYGHLVGDGVLKNVVDVVKRNLRRSDILARFGGEEFIIYLPQTDKRGALFFAERIRGAVQNYPISMSEKKLNITVSVGVVSVNPGDGKISNPEFFLEDLLEQADRALYKAKSNGRNCVVYAMV